MNIVYTEGLGNRPLTFEIWLRPMEGNYNNSSNYNDLHNYAMQRSQAGGRDGWLLQKRLNVADDHMLYLQEEGTVKERKTDKRKTGCK